ncbi:DUSP3 [Cordylochernes scorpioides]|uniref:Dual specificity protein phosphatase n=1 Tax=Cordylochernes scorpioides TaxID=51811 RepID=A0ABY6K5L1_9ARAC|nr:DUSP3 [Cordylochernes scorpioides]
MAAASGLSESQKQSLARLYKVMAEPQTAGGRYEMPLSRRIECDEVYPGIFLGDDSSARKTELLARLGITHVLNAAEGHDFGQVDTSQAYYRESGITYLGLPLMDLPSANISKFFDTAVKFIDNALASKDGYVAGKILVHCLMGMSRSPTLVVAYLISKKGMTTEEAMRLILRRREIRPNDGFLLQLLELEDKANSSKYTSRVLTPQSSKKKSK